MITVADRATFQRHREARTSSPRSGAALQELGLEMLLFGSMGAITWAIRGSNGWGGIDGTIVPGMTWGLLWYYVCCRKGIDARGIPLWLGLGIAVGGELGYGQYVSWIQGMFNVGDEIIPVAPWIGYAWFVICGIGWGATGAIALGWALGGKASPDRWLMRVFVPAGIGFLGWGLVRLCPGWFFPNYGLGLYAGELDDHLSRTVYTNTQNFAVLAWWSAALLVAAIQRDRATLIVGTLIGAGFGVGFTLGALWCLGYAYAPGFIDWWKMWELQAGFNLGALYVLALHWAIRQVDKSHNPDGVPLVASNLSSDVPDRRRNVSLTVSVFLLLYITFRGASLTLGGLLGLYDTQAMNQYAWPPARMAVFAPAAALVIGVTIFHLWRIVWSPQTETRRVFEATRLSSRMADLMTGLAFIGTVTIWPSKIGVLYAMFLVVAIFAFNRLNRRFDHIDATPARTA